MAICVDNEKCKADSTGGKSTAGNKNLATNQHNGAFRGKTWYDTGLDLLRIWATDINSNNNGYWIGEKIDELSNVSAAHIEIDIEEL